MLSLTVIGAGLAALAASMVMAVRLRREPRLAARSIMIGFAICILLVSAGMVLSLSGNGGNA